MTGNIAFENAYGGTPTWDIGRPQGAIRRLAATRDIGRVVLDVGCGTGENALYLATLGRDVTGIDFSPTAIAKAEAKARGRAIGATFLVADALCLPDVQGLPSPVDTAVDVGLLHSLQPSDWRAYAAGLAGVVRPGGNAFVLCWSDRNPFGRGPEHVSRRDIRTAFGDGWRIVAIEPERLETLLPEGEVEAWLAVLERRG